MLLNLDSLPAFHKNYVKQIEETDVLQALRLSGFRTQMLIHSIPPELADHAYSGNKWTIRELLCHLIDAERILAYRAMRFARNDKTPLPGFEENDYAPQANASGRMMKKIADDLSHLRAATVDMFESFTEDMLRRKGIANNIEMSVLVLGFVIAGHEAHHRKILNERYLSKEKDG